MAAKKVALFVDVDCLHQHLRHLHNRSLDLAALAEAAKAHGELVCADAIADWSDLPETLRAGCADHGLEAVEVTRSVRSRETNGRRRDVVRGGVDLEILARVVELLFTDGAPEVDTFVLATCDDAAARIAGVVRDKFHKRVVGLGVEAVNCQAFQAALDDYGTLDMPAIEPRDPDALSRLVPLLEDLERRKRYLNFKYIRETVLRRLDLPERSFDAAEEILSDAIACGILLKQKIDDKYNPGQLFTAYALNRESPYFAEWGSGEPAPDHDALEAAEQATSEPQGAMPALPSLGSRGGESKARGRRRKSQDSADERPDTKRPANRDDARDDDRSPDEARPRHDARARDDARSRDEDDGRNRKRRRGRGDDDKQGGKRGRKRRRGRGAGPAEDKIKLSAGGGKNKRRGGSRNHQQDRVGRMYEAPSRFLAEEQERPQLSDDEIDEDRILKARGDL